MFSKSYVRYKGYGGIKMGYGCCGNRNFLTKDEKIEMLKEYKDSLNKEAKGVGERINELEKT